MSTNFSNKQFVRKRRSNFKNFGLLNERGQSLIQVIFSAAIMAVIMLAFASMIASQVKETHALTEKLAVIDFQQQLSRSFLDGSLCTAIMTPPFSGVSPVTFTVPAGGAVPTSPLSFDLIYTSIPISSILLTSPLASAGNPISPIAPTVVAMPKPFAITEIIGSSTGTNGSFSANFQVSFVKEKVVRQLRPASTKIVLVTTGGVTGTQTITGCRTAILRSWVNVIGSRTAMHHYTNSSSNEIEVSASTASGVGFLRCSISIAVNGVSTGSNLVNNALGNATCNSTVTIPPGADYLVDNTMVPVAAAGENDIAAWAELQ